MFIGGVPAPIGTSVTAEIAGVTVASTTVTTVGKFLMAVASGSDGDGVNFRIDGVLAPQTTVFETGVTTALDLTVPAPEPVPGLTAYGLLITGALLALAIARRGQWNSSKPHNAH